MDSYRQCFLLILAMGCCATFGAQAQSNAPLMGAMSGTSPTRVAPATELPERPVVQQLQTPMAPPEKPQAPPAQAPTAPAAEAFGDVTRGLLAAQADGRRAGGTLPILGPASTAAWNRYVDSFKTPIPDWYQKRVNVQSTN